MTGSTAADATPETPTGERFDPVFMHGHLIEAEHLARYAWACQFAAGRRVLDAACGMAYGTAMLAAAGAQEVVGVDRDEGVVATVRAAAREGTRFDVGDLHGLPYGDDEFDFVVCFEAIEHVSDPDVVLDELTRVLKPDGLLLVSTPNRDVYTPGNPFHLRELTPNELADELSQRFESVALRRQHTWIASGVFDDRRFEASGNEPIESVDVRKAGENEVGLETYTIGMASNGELPVGQPLLSLTADMDLRDWSQRLDTAELALLSAPSGAATGAAETASLRREVDSLRRQLADSEAELARYIGLEAKLEAAAQALGEYDKVVANHHELLQSSSWRLTGWWRRLGAMVRNARS